MMTVVAPQDGRREFEGTVAALHLAEFHREYGKRLRGASTVPSGKFVWWLFACSCLLGLIAAGFPLVFNGQFDRTGGPVATAFCSFLVGYTMSGMAWRLVGSQAAMAYLREGGSVLGYRKIVLDLHGIVSEGGNVRNAFAWAACIDWTETDTCLVVWTDPGAGLILPKAAVGGQLDVVKAMCAKYIER
jgi:hypothetical protein